MVIEAVFEDINIKHKVIKEIEQVRPILCCVSHFMLSYSHCLWL